MWEEGYIPGILPVDVNTYTSVSKSPMTRFGTLPSAPVSSTIFATFFTHLPLDASSLAATSNPTVSPHPPIDTAIFVPLWNLGLVSETVVNSGHSVGASAFKTSDFMKARATCVMWRVRSCSGTVGCWLLGLADGIDGESEVGAYADRYMRQR